MRNKDFILASASPRRLQLLKQIGIKCKQVIAADIDETPLHKESPKNLAKRLAEEKAKKVAQTNKDTFIIAADTVVACGNRILPKAEEEDQARTCLKLISGRRHHVYGGICVITDENKVISRVRDTTVKFKRLTHQEIEHYIQGKEWQGKAGGYAIQGLAAGYVESINGSYSNVVGLSLYDILQIMNGNGFFIK